MTMIEHIDDGAHLVAIIIRREYQQDGIAFFTPPDFSQQLGYMKRPEGYVINPHVHNPVARSIELTQEVLYIKSGRIRVDFFDHAGTPLGNRILHAGDVILLASGGHGFTVLEECEIIEIKQGPYAGDQDKQQLPVPASS
jgi:hypothetical protein